MTDADPEHRPAVAATARRSGCRAAPAGSPGRRRRRPRRSRAGRRSVIAPSSTIARTVSPMNSGLPPVRSWRRRASTGVERALRRRARASSPVSASSSRRERRSGRRRGRPGRDGRLVGRLPTRTTSGSRADRPTSSSKMPDARRIEPMEVVDDDDPRTVEVEQALEVAAGDASGGRGATSAGSGGTSVGLGLPARERGVAGDRRRSAPAQRRASAGSASALNSSRRANDPESVPCSSATTWASDRPNRYGSTAAVRHVVDPGPGEPGRAGRPPRGPASSRDLPMPASPSTTERPAAGRARAGRRAARGQVPLGGPPDEPARPAAATAGTRRRRAAGRSGPAGSGRGGRARRGPRRRGPCGPPGRVASSRRISPGSAMPWIRAAVVTAGPVSDQSMRARDVARRGDDLAGREPDPDLERLAAPDPRAGPGRPRIASAQWVARRASSSWATGQPKTAKTASPMNFSRVPSNALIASTIAASAASTRRRTSSGSCSATSRT